MIRTRRLFLVISVLIFLSDAAFVALNYHFSRAAFDTSLTEQSERLYEEFSLIMSLSYRNMEKLATYIAMEPEIRRRFLEGKQAVAAEGGGPGGARAAAARAALHQAVRAPWQVMTERFGLRQLHFLLGPGALSFLRVHAPGKFGDRMDDLRHIIVDTNAERTPRTGFETGRVYCGVRGVVPVGAVDPATGREVHVGALEVGTSFSPLLKTFDRFLTSGLAILLAQEHVREAMWPAYVQTRFGGRMADPSGFVVEATNRPEIERLLSMVAPPSLARPTPPVTVTLDRAIYAISFFPLRDYAGERRPGRPAVGVVALWKEVTPAWNEFVSSQRINVAYALAGFVMVELLLFYGYRFGARKLTALVEEQTEEIRAERERAVAANALKDTFVSLVAHDLRSPLAGIKGLADLMVQRPDDPDLGMKAARELGRSAEHMLAMIAELLDLNRLQDGSVVLKQADIPLAALLASALAPLAAVASEKGVALEVRVGGDERLRADPDLLREAVRNLVSNGIKFCRRGGTVRVAALPGGRGLVVEDDGVGVTPERIPTLTRLEVKTSTLGSAGERGTGLGLPFVDLIVKAHGGSLGIESAAGKGTRITITLPANR